MALDKSKTGALLSDAQVTWLSGDVSQFLTESNAERILANPRLWFTESTDAAVSDAEVSTYLRNQRLASDPRNLTADMGRREIVAGRKATRRQLIAARVFIDLRAQADHELAKKLNAHGQGELAESIAKGIAERQKRESPFRAVIADVITDEAWRAEALELVGVPLTAEAEAELLGGMNQGTLQVMEIEQLQDWQVRIDSQAAQLAARVQWRRDLLHGGAGTAGDGWEQIARLKAASATLGEAIAAKLADLSESEAREAEQRHAERLREIRRKREQARAELIQLDEAESAALAEDERRRMAVAITRPA